MSDVEASVNDLPEKTDRLAGIGDGGAEGDVDSTNQTKGDVDVANNKSRVVAEMSKDRSNVEEGQKEQRETNENNQGATEAQLNKVSNQPLQESAEQGGNEAKVANDLADKGENIANTAKENPGWRKQLSDYFSGKAGKDTYIENVLQALAIVGSFIAFETEDPFGNKSPNEFAQFVSGCYAFNPNTLELRPLGACTTQHTQGDHVPASGNQPAYTQEIVKFANPNKCCSTVNSAGLCPLTCSDPSQFLCQYSSTLGEAANKIPCYNADYICKTCCSSSLRDNEIAKVICMDANDLFYMMSVLSGSIPSWQKPKPNIAVMVLSIAGGVGLLFAIIWYIIHIIHVINENKIQTKKK